VAEAKTNGIVTYYEDTGQGPTVVLIHGHSLDLRMWKYQVGPLVDMGYRVVRYDVRGHGRSTAPESGYTWDNYSQDLADLLDQLPADRADGEPASEVHVVGLSMGGGVALKFALDHPERTKSLTLVDSTLPGFTYSPEFSGWIIELRDTVRREGAHPTLERLWLSSRIFDGLRRHPEMFAEVAEMVSGFQATEYLEEAQADYIPTDLAPRLGEVAAPTLVVVGEEDLPDFLLVAELLAANIPNARLVKFAGCGHAPPMEDPAAFNGALLEFLVAAQA
jgi:pimeloyl-ACP methyl ester carboxylesterase